MRHRTHSNRALVLAVALAAGVLSVSGTVGAQPTRGKNKAKTEKGVETKRMGLTDEQRANVDEIMKAHREASRRELREKLSEILTPEQLDAFDERWERGPMPMSGERDFRFERRGSRHGRRGGDCERCCGDRGGDRRGFHGRGERGMGEHGRGGPRMGEFRGERGERLAEHLTRALDLNTEQREQIEAIVEKHHEQFKDVDPSTLSFEERQKTREAHRTLLHNQIKQVLTADQQEKFEDWLESAPGPHHRTRGR